MTEQARTVVVVGGGTAGWLTACVVAAERRSVGDAATSVVLIESPDIPTIGVGEGTWPSLRMTLQRIGLSEKELLKTADASFKQGTTFVGWRDDAASEPYYHPFTLPVAYSTTNLADTWLAHDGDRSFAEFVTPQAAVIEAGLAPKQAGMPEYAFAVNYGYHLDAGKFAELLRAHAVNQLQVRHVLANVAHVEGAQDADIEALRLDSGERIAGTLFVDCTGHRALLLGGHYGVALTTVDDVLFNNSAVAAQVPYRAGDAPIASTTISTATSAGWIWDIALPSRRGIGYVYADAFIDETAVRAELQRYIEAEPDLDGSASDPANWRTLKFQPGYREQFWVRNCVGVGLAAGFVEPLEASAIALIEQSAALIARQLPRDRDIMDVVARQFNEKLHYHWQRIVEFLKLHYVLSNRSGAYWQAHRDSGSWPGQLQDRLTLWRQQAPYHLDAPMIDELFPSASYQFILYGMGYKPDHVERCIRPEAQQAVREVHEQQRRYLAGLQPNRTLIEELLSS